MHLTRRLWQVQSGGTNDGREQSQTRNLANKMNVAAVNPLYTYAGQATAAYDPRQFQFAMKLNW